MKRIFCLNTVVVLIFLAMLVMFLSGCTFPFSGERDVSAKLNVLGNTFEWQSKAVGTYTRCATESPVIAK